MGYMNMTTFSAVRIPIRTEKGTMVKRRRAGVRYLRWVIARRVYRDPASPRARSEEHTSELQSLRHLVCRLLLEKKRSGPLSDENATPTALSSIYTTSASVN